MFYCDIFTHIIVYFSNLSPSPTTSHPTPTLYSLLLLPSSFLYPKQILHLFSCHIIHTLDPNLKISSYLFMTTF